ncbi:MAG: carboxypeptidase-like regulatory domain-containing protein, partial [Acidobacteria bacterium]|nr:carboxypeptidase-like regulatory domain-containing protein [Acidobacteriota bacterium]
MHPCRRVQKQSSLRRLALSISFLLSSVLFQLAFAPVAAAQITTAQVSGIVMDSQGLSVPSARIVLRQQSTGQTFQAITNESGAYVASSLPVGAYSLTVEHLGFKQYTRGG